MTARDVLLMRVDLEAALPEPDFPDGIRVRTASVEADAPAVHALLVEAFAGSREHVLPFEQWLPWWTRDESFDPACWFLAEQEGSLAGVALCWDTGYVKDLAVRPDRRRRGLGEALLRHAFRAFAARGVDVVSLKVDAANPTGAVRLYDRVGMRVAERLTIEDE